MDENGSYYVCNEKLRVPDNNSTMNEVNDDLNDTPEEKGFNRDDKKCDVR